MRIGINTLFLIPGEVGGTETYFRRILYHIAAQFPDTTLILFTNRENDQLLRKDMSGFKQVEFWPLHFYASNRFVRIIREQTQLPLKVKKARIDLLWSPGNTIPFFCPCPQVTTIHDMQYKTHPEDLSFLAFRATEILIYLAALRSKQILTISEFSKKEIIKYTQAHPDKIEAIHLAASEKFASMVSETSDVHPSKLPGETGNSFILTVANTYPHKGIHTLVEAYGSIMSQIDCDLVLVGRPRRGEKKVREAINGLSNPDRLIRLSGLSHSGLVYLYRKARMFVFPSLYEGFGLPILEAMMAGTPVLTTKMGSIPEIAKEYAVYADPLDSKKLAAKMIEILNWGRHYRRRWVANASDHAKTFKWESAANKTMEVLWEAFENYYRPEKCKYFKLDKIE